MKIVISEFMDETALEEFGAGDRVQYAPGLVDDRPALLQAVADADALIVRNRTQVNTELLEAAPGLRVVGRLGVGLDNIDLDACKTRGIAVCPATGANTLSVAEYVIAVTLSLLRRAYAANAAMIAGDWPRNTLIGGEASGRCIGLWGYGGIARAVADRARALGMSVAAMDPYLPADDPAWAGIARCETPADLLDRADVLSLHVPLTDETRNMIDADAIARMRPGAILINTARGGIVDEAALVMALVSGKLGGAALDVFATEPLTAAAGSMFDGVPNLILTPHIAGVTDEGNVRVSSVTVENVKRELSHG
ncbi:3-phosphoglycerate dehydrogenase [Rhodobacteraceae bacterium 2CG4]|uniref:3-phosphoglycerate dehydrogenase n=1 Tax=Halovulum marinum TaxID=2662447 RepID=A0A6L5Z1K3_9RHOB|nr:hydroxyacid dehydrogenase [Halovulum marinum]MSU90437.1 3-phosphoglycerate dehydrogenase [Halovulum marinum]